MKRETRLREDLRGSWVNDPLVQGACLCFAVIAVLVGLGCNGVGSTSLSISPQSCTFNTTSDSQQLKVTGSDSGGGTSDLTSAASGTTYTSSNEKVATVTSGGLVKAKSPIQCERRAIADINAQRERGDSQPSA